MGLLRLAAGPLTMLFDHEHGFLRHVCWHDQEIVRGIYAAVRDRDWDTIPFTVHGLELDSTDDGFAISFLANCRHNEVQFGWRGDITGRPTGCVTYKFAGQALSTFQKNRIGLCVLHPIKECAGQACTVVHNDGTEAQTQFPKWISPHQPFKDIQSITHAVEGGAKVKVTFRGESFEMEDQRNWTDGSYKTYSTPLELPFPVQLAAGAQIDHEVTIELIGAELIGASPARRSVRSTNEDAAARIGVDWQRSQPIPPIGLSLATCHDRPSTAVIEMLKVIRPSHLRVDLAFEHPDWADRTTDALELADATGAQLEVAIFTEPSAQAIWRACYERLNHESNRIARWLVFHRRAKSTPADLAHSAYQTLRSFDPSIPIAVGTNAYFAELNRDRPPVSDHGLVCYSINPQVHAFDSLSLRETLEAQRWTVDSAYKLFGCPVIVSPITLRPRFNPNATSTEATDGWMGAPETDPRQPTGFAAAWTVGTLSQLATHPKVSSLTFYETHGARGIMDSDANTYPLFDVFRAVRSSVSICETTSSQPCDVRALALLGTDRRRSLLLANMSAEAHDVIVQPTGEEQLHLKLEAESVQVVSHGERQ